jgi:hypothetical protein
MIKPMNIPDEKLDKFRKLYKKHFNKSLSREEARNKGAQLIRLLEIILKEQPQKNGQ